MSRLAILTPAARRDLHDAMTWIARDDPTAARRLRVLHMARDIASVLAAIEG